MKRQNILILSATILLLSLFGGGAYLYKSYLEGKGGSFSKEKSNLFMREHSPQMGSDDAQVYLVEFLDPECETCREFYPFVKKMLADYAGKVKLIIRYAPFHPNSIYAIKILEAARLQGKYWEALELLFAYQPQWGDHHHPQPELIWKYLPEIQVDIERIKKDMESPHIAKMIEQDVSDGKELEVRATPTFFVNGQPLKSFGYTQLQDAIESELKNKE